jgi:hypothetical protein
MSLRRSAGFCLIALPFVAIAAIAYSIGGILAVVIPYGATAVIVSVIAAGIILASD